MIETRGQVRGGGGVDGCINRAKQIQGRAYTRTYIHCLEKNVNVCFKVLRFHIKEE